MLRQMVDAGVSDCVMEVSSHALAQHRARASQFAAALFTNLTQDHLDYHAGMAAYFAAKARLFTTYQPGVAVLNNDDPPGEKLIHETPAPVITYGFSPGSDVGVEHLAIDAGGIDLTVRMEPHPVTVRSQLIGRHNVYISWGYWQRRRGSAWGLATVQGIERLRAVPAALSVLMAGQPFSVLVDYAHTDDACAMSSRLPMASRRAESCCLRRGRRP